MPSAPPSALPQSSSRPARRASAPSTAVAGGGGGGAEEEEEDGEGEDDEEEDEEAVAAAERVRRRSEAAATATTPRSCGSIVRASRTFEREGRNVGSPHYFLRANVTDGRRFVELSVIQQDFPTTTL